MRYLAALCVVPVLVGCSSPPGVEGDISVNGTKASYATVALVRNADDAVLTAVGAACEAERLAIQRTTERARAFEADRERFKRVRARSTIEQVALSDSVEKYRMAAANEQRALAERPDTMHTYNQGLVRAATDTEVQSDRDGRFKFVDRKAGQYLVYAVIPGQDEAEVLAPVTLAAKGTKKLSLDQTAVSTKLRCR